MTTLVNWTNPNGTPSQLVFNDTFLVETVTDHGVAEWEAKLGCNAGSLGPAIALTYANRLEYRTQTVFNTTFEEYSRAITSTDGAIADLQPAQAARVLAKKQAPQSAPQ